MLETNGPSLFECVTSAWRAGGRKWFLHNLSCELRRGRDEGCQGYQGTFWDRFLFSLGMFFCDPIGRYYFQRTEWDSKFRLSSKVSMFDRQWLRHPAPWVRSHAKRTIASIEGK